MTNDDHSVEVGGTIVSVRGKTGPVHATWTLLLDGQEVDRAKAAGDFTLTGTLPDGSTVNAAVRQSLMGPTKVTIGHRGDEVAEFTGFVA